ncbi:hypothetical protein [Fulvivirga sp.]|uniref:hypothetical protein n=1 Tax=Fulvivirga sp. TaxID=1931237 RepID=UPI0032ED1C2D
MRNSQLVNIVSFLVAMVLCSISDLLAQNKLSNLKSPFSKYEVSTTECSKIMHHSGSLIYIPSNAFAVDVSKIDVVTLLYREVRTPSEMLIHNINMTTQLMGKTFYLESNGMFEIYCLNDLDTVQVHEDRSIVVRLALPSKEVDVTMEGFRYNEKEGLWDSYTNRIQPLFLNDKDDDLWGSGIVQSNAENVEVMEPGWDDEWVVDPAWARQDSLRNLAFQTMEIFDFGLYNYDRIINGEEFVPYVPQFVNQNNDSIKTDVYVVYEGLNTVIYFNEYNWAKDFTLIKNRKYSMFTVDKDGAIFKLNQYPELTAAGSTLTFMLEKKADLPKSADELSKLIGTR